MQLELNRRSKVPMYRQLAAELREQIVSGAMAEGYRLPPERELSSRLEVNRTTVLQAYQQLKDEGLIASKVGKGGPASATEHRTVKGDFECNNARRLQQKWEHRKPPLPVRRTT